MDDLKNNLALRNYEILFKLPEGSATLDEVKATSGGVNKYSKQSPPEDHEGYDEIIQMQ